ncbi:MAG: hypothetical protein ACRDNY_11640 [Gaiellaceae bacterium]
MIATALIATSGGIGSPAGVPSSVPEATNRGAEDTVGPKASGSARQPVRYERMRRVYEQMNMYAEQLRLEVDKARLDMLVVAKLRAQLRTLANRL